MCTSNVILMRIHTERAYFDDKNDLLSNKWTPLDCLGGLFLKKCYIKQQLTSLHTILVTN